MQKPAMFHALVASFSCFSLVGIPIAAIQIYFGASALDNCPMQPMIPKWLVGEFHLNPEYALCKYMYYSHFQLQELYGWLHSYTTSHFKFG